LDGWTDQTHKISTFLHFLLLITMTTTTTAAHFPE
jgi:hypothetical protein